MRSIEHIEKEAGAKLPREAVSTRVGGGNTKLSYVEAHYVIQKMNDVFGPTGWDSETVEMREVPGNTNKAGKQLVAYVAKVRVTALVALADGGFMKSVKEGWGYGCDKAEMNAHEMAIKEAESDAFKRAARQFGMSLGLALYDKSQENVEDSPAKESPQGGSPTNAGAAAPPLKAHRETLNKTITAASRTLLDKAGPEGSPERAAKTEEVKALLASYKVTKKEDLTDSQAQELVNKLKEMLK